MPGPADAGEGALEDALEVVILVDTVRRDNHICCPTLALADPMRHLVMQARQLPIQFLSASLDWAVVVVSVALLKEELLAPLDKYGPDVLNAVDIRIVPLALDDINEVHESVVHCVRVADADTRVLTTYFWLSTHSPLQACKCLRSVDLPISLMHSFSNSNSMRPAWRSE